MPKGYPKNNKLSPDDPMAYEDIVPDYSAIKKRGRPRTKKQVQNIRIDYNPRKEQVEIHKAIRQYRWTVIVAHRRMGKTIAVINHLIMSCLTCKKVRPHFAYVAPQLKQAKFIAWEYLKHYTKPIPGVKWNESELSVLLPNRGKVRLFGADNPDSLRGLYFDGVVLDEVAQMKSEVWGEVISPALVDRHGWACFIGCVTGGTIVLGRNGFCRIDSFKDGERERELIPCNEELYGINREFHAADGFWYNGKCKVKKVTTCKGYSLTGSLKHPVLVMGQDGHETWKKMSDLEIGDHVAISRGMEVWAGENPLDGFAEIIKGIRAEQHRHQGPNGNKLDIPAEMTEDLAYFCGLWIAEGSSEEKIYRLTITYGDDEVVENYIDDGILGIKPKRSREDQIRFNSVELIELFKHLGMPLCKGPKKFIPTWVFNGKREWALSFLAGLFDGDGHCDKVRRRVGICSSSERLIDDLHLLLLNIGVVAAKGVYVTPPNDLVKVESTSYRLEIVGESATLFKQIPLRVKRKREQLLAQHEKFDRKDCVPCQWWVKNHKSGNISYWRLRNEAPELKVVSDHYYWDKVKIIETGEEVTYDFIVPDTHSFWSNGLISHNTPRGVNLFSELYFTGLRKKRNWKCLMYRADQTAVIPKKELEEVRSNMSEAQFRQEFLCDFAASSDDIYISLDLVRKAREVELTRSMYDWAPVVMGVDVARFGDDLSVIAIRQGLKLRMIKSWHGLDLMAFADRVAKYIQEYKPSRVYIDSVGLGAGLVDRLRQMGFTVFEVNGASSPTDPKYKNKRAECWGEMKKWLESGGSIPEDPILQADLCGLTYSFDSADKLVIEKKSDARKRGIPSPNGADALSYTWAYKTPLNERKKAMSLAEKDWMDMTGQMNCGHAVNMEG